MESQVISLSKQVSAIEESNKNKDESQFHEISFDNNDSTEPPKWFFDDSIFDDLEQGMLKYLSHTKEKNFEDICRGLELNNELKRQFNIQVIKLCCKDWITKCL